MPILPPGPSGTGNADKPFWGAPGGAVQAGLREPFGDILGPRRQRALVYDITHFDPSWGPPPPRIGMRFDTERHVYEVTGRPGERSRALDLAAQMERSGVYLQPYLDEDSFPPVWRERYVRVPTATPTIGQPYTILGAESEMGVSELEREQEQASADRLRLVQASREGELIARLRGGKTVSPAELGLSARVKPIAEAPPKQWNLGKYAWLTEKDFPPNCPRYPYPSMPVPLADYSSGRWLKSDYTPSIPLPPPYDSVPWRCVIAGGPSEAPMGPRGTTGLLGPKGPTGPQPPEPPELPPLPERPELPPLPGMPDEPPPPGGPLPPLPGRPDLPPLPDLPGLRGRSFGASSEVTEYPAPGLPASS